MAFEERIEGPLGAGVHLCRQTLIGGQPPQRGGYEVSTAAAQDGVGAHGRASIAWFVSAVLTATPGFPPRVRVSPARPTQGHSPALTGNYALTTGIISDKGWTRHRRAMTDKRTWNSVL